MVVNVVGWAGEGHGQGAAAAGGGGDVEGEVAAEARRVVHRGQGHEAGHGDGGVLPQVVPAQAQAGTALTWYCSSTCRRVRWRGWSCAPWPPRPRRCAGTWRAPPRRWSQPPPRRTPAPRGCSCPPPPTHSRSLASLEILCGVLSYFHPRAKGRQ